MQQKEKPDQKCCCQLGSHHPDFLPDSGLWRNPTNRACDQRINHAAASHMDHNTDRHRHIFFPVNDSRNAKAPADHHTTDHHLRKLIPGKAEISAIIQVKYHSDKTENSKCNPCADSNIFRCFFYNRFHAFLSFLRTLFEHASLCQVRADTNLVIEKLYFSIFIPPTDQDIS